MEEPKEGVSVWNPDKQLSEQVTLKNIVTHDKAMDLARKGIPELQSDKPLSFNERISLRFKGLNEMIPAQQSIITNNRAIVKANSLEKWGKKNKTEEERLKNKFEDEDNEYNEFMAISFFLDDCEQKIITARMTKTFKDDFVWEETNREGEKILKLTQNFFKMMKNLENSYEAIYTILISNKIVSSGIPADEEVSDKEIEAEQYRRIIGS